MANNKIKLFAVVGPTASGKTALSIELARRMGGEIVCCDSMQIYRRMEIGTAKPTAEERSAVPHRMFDLADPEEPYSCADYVRDAASEIGEITARGVIPILCGGTGLYLDSLLRGGSFEETEVDPALREELRLFAEREGNHALHERLRAVDPASAEAIHENNVKRVIRALEIFYGTGMTKTEADKRSRAVESPYDATVIGLRFESRELLYRRIDRRVELMLEAGLLEETRRLRDEGVFERNATAAQAIGYKELLGYLDGKAGLAESVETLKRATRRYAKRQMTWFGAKEYVRWLTLDREGEMKPAEEILAQALALCE